MKFTIISPGKFTSDAQKQIFNEYTKRLKWKIDLKELNIKTSTSMPPAKIKELEEAQITKNLSPNSYLITLDEKADQLSSINFADLIKKTSTTNPNIDLIIGGAFGLSQNLQKKSNYKLSLGKMTFPHLIVRLLLIEQIYRAQTIIDGHPYHKN